MRIYLTDQSRRLAALLPQFKAQPISYEDLTLLHEKRTTRRIATLPALTDLRRCDTRFLFDYDIFPPEILTAICEWRLQDRPMQVGDIIVQQAQFPPARFSAKLVFAVRILATVRTAARVGFQYGTLAGHVETGLSDFSLVLQDRELHAQIHTYSEPAQWPARVAAPLLTRPYQQYCTDRALDHMRNAFLLANPEMAA
jgi:hypothetical protein